jgi:hypothetical protein
LHHRAPVYGGGFPLGIGGRESKLHATTLACRGDLRLRAR